MSDPTIVSHSEVESYLACEKRHYFAFGERLTRPTEPGSLNAMEKGTLGHAVMEAFFTSRQEGDDYDTAQEKALVAIRNELTKPSPDFETIMRIELVTQRFLDGHRERLEYIKPVHIEQEFWLELGDDIRYPFKPDLVAYDGGVLTLFDYKFVGQFYTDKETGLFPQLPKYMGALRAVGVDVRKAAYMFFSTNKAVNPHKADLHKVAQIMPVSINDARLKRSWYEQIAATHRIAQVKQQDLETWEKTSLRATNKFCGYCTFQPLCTALLQGSDGRILRQSEYVPSTYGYTEKKENDS